MGVTHPQMYCIYSSIAGIITSVKGVTYPKPQVIYSMVLHCFFMTMV